MAHVVFGIRVDDPDAFGTYQRLAKASMEQYGAKLVSKGQAEAALMALHQCVTTEEEEATVALVAFNTEEASVTLSRVAFTVAVVASNLTFSDCLQGWSIPCSSAAR